MSAWQSLAIFLALNGHRLEVGTENAVSLMLGVAAGEFDEAAVAEWLLQHLEPMAPDDQR